jgi:uncharacterized protein YutE (UPF0331/DUF86 family)
MSREGLLADQDALDIACYRLLVAIEAALALCFQVLAKRLRRAPEEYAECFGIFRDAGILLGDLRAFAVAAMRGCLVPLALLASDLRFPESAARML